MNTGYILIPTVAPVPANATPAEVVSALSGFAIYPCDADQLKTIIIAGGESLEPKDAGDPMDPLREWLERERKSG